MLKKFKNLVVGLILCGLVFSNFSQTVKAQQTNQALSQSPVLLVQTEVKVVSLQKNQEQVVVNQTPVVKNNCAVTAPHSNNLVQDTGLINFNQPAGCFNLVLGKTPSLAALQVTEVVQSTQVIKVVTTRPYLSSGSFDASPVHGQSLPLMPGVYAVFLPAIFEGLRKVHNKILAKQNSSSVFRTNFGLVEVLRC